MGKGIIIMTNFMTLEGKSKAFSLLALLAASSISAAELDDKIIAMSQDNSVTMQGKALFEQVCASCHAKDLSGSTGFNLKDGEWIHGSEPSAIINNIKNGFANAGMPGFGAVYSEEQLQAIVAYILSKREGFDNLTYKIYQMTDSKDKEINEQKLIKQGRIASNFADFQLPEIQHYVIEFEGDFYTLKDEDTKVWIQWGKPIDVTFEVNGKEVKRNGEWDPTWKLARGKQHLKITYRSGTNKLHQRNLPLIVTNHDMSIKLFPISDRARAIMLEKKVEVKAENQTVIQRKKVMNVPVYSISVGLPTKINYAFNSRSCDIVGLWQGDMLNVGPNVGGRGQDGSLPLGEWWFHAPQSLEQQTTDKAKCRYKGYQLKNNEPVFNYQLAGVDYSLTASAESDKEITFFYQVDSAVKSAVTFNLPQANQFSWYTAGAKIKNKSVTIKPDPQGQFAITAKIN